MFKLALRNVKKSYRDYSIYFVTLAFCIAFFYIFGTFEEQVRLFDVGTQMHDAIEFINVSINLISAIVIFIFAFVMIYANNFIYRRRKRELGLYLLMGMPFYRLSLVLIFETVIISMLALMIGLVMGLLGSQLATVLVGSMLAVPINYRFIVSAHAAKQTVTLFGIVFILIIILNQKKLRKSKLHQLFENRLEPIAEGTFAFIKNMLLFFIAILILGCAYYWALQPFQLIVFLPVIVILGSFATFQMFKYGTRGLFSLLKYNRAYYLSEINMFTFRQVSVKMMQTYRVMAIVSITLLFGISILITGINMNEGVRHEIERANPYDITLEILRDDDGHNDDILDVIESVNVFETRMFVRVFRSEEFGTDLLENFTFPDTFKHDAMGLMNLTDYNKARHNQGYEELKIPNGMFVIQDQSERNSTVKPTLNDEAASRIAITIGTEHYTRFDVKSLPYSYFANGDGDYYVVIMNDHDAAHIYEQWNDLFVRQILNLNVEESMTERVPEITETLTTRLYELNPDAYSRRVVTRYNSMMFSKGTEVIFSLMGLYLGAVFIVASLVILALQQISEAGDNRDRYHVLNELGVPVKYINRSLKKQITIYFIVPLCVGLIHTIFGLAAIQVNLNIFGFGISNWTLTILLLLMIILSYSIYFMIAYVNSKRIIGLK